MSPEAINQDRIDELKRHLSGTDQAAEVAAEGKSSNIDQVLYSIGYANLIHIDKLVDIMKSYGIKILLDVRSKPNTRRFSKSDFQKRTDIVYISRPEMGGLNFEIEQYDEWLLLAQDGINQLAKTASNGDKVMIMCMEKNPDKCHRKYFVAKALEEKGITVKHL